MKRSRALRVAMVVVGLLVLVTVLLWPASRAERVRIAGTGEVAALARADAASELVLAEALDAARAEAARRGVKAFIVHRRGHRVFEYFADGVGGGDQVDGAELAAAVLQLALHQPEDTTADLATAAQLVSERIWLPLRAADAWLVDQPGVHPRRCCIEARLDDWTRVADLLNATGTYHGERVVAADAVRALLAQRPLQWTGDEPFLARDGAPFDLADGARVWLAPGRGLTMLVWADGAQAQDTLLPNILMRGLNDASPAIGGDLPDLVPGH